MPKICDALFVETEYLCSTIGDISTQRVRTYVRTSGRGTWRVERGAWSVIAAEWLRTLSVGLGRECLFVWLNKV